jgi:hypothetical protein
VKGVPNYTVTFGNVDLKLNYSVRVKAALLIIILSALVSSAVSLGMELRKFVEPPSVDKIALTERRLACLIPFLAGGEVVGYLTDLKTDKEYAKMQYVLTPVIIVRETSRPLVIGNFHKPVNVDEISRKNDLVLLKKCDNGILLFEKKKQ